MAKVEEIHHRERFISMARCWIILAIIAMLTLETLAVRAGQKSQLFFSVDVSEPAHTVKVSYRGNFYHVTFDINGNLTDTNIDDGKIISSDRSENQLIVNIAIENVKSIDDDEYICRVYDINGIEILGRRVVQRLEVELPPLPANCSVDRNVRKIYWISLTCKVEISGHPKGEFACYQRNRQLPDRECRRTGNALQALSCDYWIDEAFPFSCCSRSSSFMKDEKNCTDFKWPPIGKLRSSTVADSTTRNDVRTEPFVLTSKYYDTLTVDTTTDERYTENELSCHCNSCSGIIVATILGWVLCILGIVFVGIIMKIYRLEPRHHGDHKHHRDKTHADEAMPMQRQ